MNRIILSILLIPTILLADPYNNRAKTPVHIFSGKGESAENPLVASVQNVGTNALEVSGSLTVSDGGSSSVTNPVNISFANTFAIDAFGRQRTSSPRTLFDSKQLGSEPTLVWDEVTNNLGTASSVYTRAQSSKDMYVGADTEYVIRQSTERYPYQPGKSQLIMMTGVFGAPIPDTEWRVGYFNTGTDAPYTNLIDGIYVMSDGTNICMAIGNNGEETRVPQSAWNVDKLDGTGESGITIDFNKAQILWIDFEWLGVGRVRTGFVIDGIVYYVHDFNHANSVEGVYMRSPNHSVRYEIRSHGGDAVLEEICATVISEGDQDPTGPIIAVSSHPVSGGVTINNGLSGPVMAIRLRDQAEDCFITPLTIDTAFDGTKGAPYRWTLAANPDFGDNTNPWVNASGDCIEYSMIQQQHTITNYGLVLASGYGYEGASAAAEAKTSLSLGTSIDGTKDELYILIDNGTGGNGAFYGVIEWQEFK